MRRIQLIRKAIDFATIKHSGQIRKGSGLDYVTHPIKVGFMLQELNAPLAVVLAGFLHDTLEDTDTTYEELLKEFGKEVVDIVVEMTTDEDLKKKMGKNKYLIQKMSFQMSDNGLLCKLVDRLDNISDLPRQGYLDDTKVMVKELLENRDLTIEALEAIDRIQEIL